MDSVPSFPPEPGTPAELRAENTQLRAHLDSAQTILIGIGSQVDLWREWDGGERDEAVAGRGLYRIVGNIRSYTEAIRQDSALVQRQVHEASRWLEMILAKPTDDPQWEAVAMLRNDLAHIANLLSGAHAAAPDSRFVAGDSQ